MAADSMIIKGESAVNSMQLRPTPLDTRRSILGFTLIELMIVVAVVAILAAVAVPTYQEQVRKSRRGQAKADMVELAQLAERFHTANNTYAGFTLSVDQARSPRQGATIHYNLVADGLAQNTFLITATPQGAQAVDRCGTLTVNQAGQKTRSGAAPFNECW